jgi:hypothetical protein
MRDVKDVAAELDRCQDLWQYKIITPGFHYNNNHPKFLEFYHRLDERGRVLDWVLADSDKGGDLTSLRDLFNRYNEELYEEDQVSEAAEAEAVDTGFQERVERTEE